MSQLVVGAALITQIVGFDSQVTDLRADRLTVIQAKA